MSRKSGRYGEIGPGWTGDAPEGRRVPLAPIALIIAFAVIGGIAALYGFNPFAAPQ